MNTLMQWYTTYHQQTILTIQLFCVVFFTLTLHFFEKRIYKRLINKLQETKNPWDDAVVMAAHRPVRLLILLFGLSLALEVIQGTTGTFTLLDNIGPLRQLCVIGLITWFFIRFIHAAEKNLIAANNEHVNVDKTTVDALGKLLRLSVIATAVIISLQTLNYSISGVLAFGGAGTLILGLAGKDLLANFFGGLMVYLDRPFSVGDWICSPDRKIEGTVEKIGWRLTRIRTFDKRPLFIPNSVFTTVVIENPSRMLNRRIYETIGLRYEDSDKIATILNAVETYLRQHKEIDNQQTLMVHLNRFAPSSLEFFIYTFTKTTNWTAFHKIKQAILLDILAIIAEQGAEVAFPSSTIYTPDISLEHKVDVSQHQS